MRILVIADPINDVYGGLPSRDLATLRGAGIDVVIARPRLACAIRIAIYSAFWRLTMSWWSGDGSGEASLPNPLDAGPDRVTFGAWARLLNFKADHRKVIIGDDGKGGMTGIVTSANPHDASSRHSNVASEADRGGARPAARERAGHRRAARAGTAAGKSPEVPAATALTPETTARVQVLTESEIRAAIVRNFAGARVGDSIDIAMFYLSDREVIQALLAAARRGVAVRVLLDPNKDAFGRTKNGIPNRSVATELAAASDGAIKVRWFRTHGEQFHSKLVTLRSADGILVHARLRQPHAAQPRRLQPRGQRRGQRAAERRDRHADQRLVRLAVDQPRTARARVHRGVRRVRRSCAEQLLALSHHGSDRSIYLLTAAGRRPAFRWRRPRTLRARARPLQPQWRIRMPRPPR